MIEYIYILAILMFVAAVVSVWFAFKCKRLSKELAKRKQTTSVKTFGVERKNIKEISSIVEIPFPLSDSIDENEIKESLIKEMYPELKSCLEYYIDKDILTLNVKCMGRLKIVEVK